MNAKWAAPSVREILEGMDRNIAHAERNIFMLRDNDTWQEIGDKGICRVTAPQGEESPVVWIANERQRLLRRFKAEKAHWIRKRDYWRNLDANASEPGSAG